MTKPLNDPTVECCGRDAADCDCPEVRLDIKVVPISETPLFDSLGLEVTRGWSFEIPASLQMAGFVASRLDTRTLAVTGEVYAEMVRIFGEKRLAVSQEVSLDLVGPPVSPMLPQSATPKKSGNPMPKGTLAKLLGPGGGLPVRKSRTRPARVYFPITSDPATQPIEGLIMDKE